MTTVDTLNTRPSQRNWLLITSLAVNLLVVGSITGAMLSHRGHSFPRGGGLSQRPDPWNPGRLMNNEQGLPGFVRTLPPERQAVLQPLQQQAVQTLKPLRQAAQQRREAVHEALRAEPFDSQRLEKAMDEVFIAEGAARRATVSLLASALALLTPAERAQFLHWRKAHETAPLPPLAPPSPEAGAPK